MISNTIAVGMLSPTQYKLLPWRNSNGILLAGISGQGKSHTANFLLTQLAYNGTYLAVCDYGANNQQEQTLISRIEHLEPMFIQKPSFSGNSIVDTVERVEKLGNDRMSGLIPQNEHYPIMVVIDEFATFCINHQPPNKTTTVISGNKFEEGETREVKAAPTHLDIILGSILRFRKINIHYMLIGQEWASLGSHSIRRLRSNLTDKVCHRLDKNLSNLFFEESIDKKNCQKLNIWQVLYNGDVLTIPVITDNVLKAVHEKTKLYDRKRI